MHSFKNLCKQNVVPGLDAHSDGIPPGGGGGGGGTLIFSHIRRLGPFFWVQNSEFQYFFRFSEK